MLRGNRRLGRGLAVSTACAFIVSAALAGPSANAQSADAPFRMVVIDDMSGIYAGNGGPGSLLGATMAVEDFGGKVLGRKIEMLSADHQSKPDIGASLARQFMDQQNVSAIVNGARAITADTALRLGTYFHVSPETWLGLQIDYDLRLILQLHGERIISSIRTRPAA